METFGLSAAGVERTPRPNRHAGSSARSAMLGMRWDEAVDVAYVGSGAGLAAAIVAVDAGEMAFVPDSGSSTTGIDGRLGVNVPDAENRYTPENGVERKQQPSRGRRPGVVSPGVDRLSKRDATRRFAVGAVCSSRRGRHRRWQKDWSQAVADLSSANGGAAPARFKGRNIVGAQADRRPQARVPNPWLPAGRVPSTLGEL